MLLRHVTDARAVGGHRLHLRFDDGVEGEVDLRPIIGEFKNLFAPLADPAYVAKVRVNEDFGTVCWPNGVDLDPVVLYCAVKGIPVPTAKDVPTTRPTRARRSRRPSDASGRSRRRNQT